MMTDPISDMLTRLRNAALARKDRADLPHSILKERLAEILKEEGYVLDYQVDDGVLKTLTVFLRYTKDRKAAFQGIRRVSRPGRRLYVGHEKIPRVLNGLGVAILSTSKGVMTGKRARTEKVGGEVLCEVW